MHQNFSVLFPVTNKRSKIMMQGVGVETLERGIRQGVCVCVWWKLQMRCADNFSHRSHPSYKTSLLHIHKNINLHQRHIERDFAPRSVCQLTHICVVRRHVPAVPAILKCSQSLKQSLFVTHIYFNRNVNVQYYL